MASGWQLVGKILAVPQKPCGTGSSYLVGTLVGDICVQCYVETLFDLCPCSSGLDLYILSRLYLWNCNLYEDTWQGHQYDVGIQRNGITFI